MKKDHRVLQGSELAGLVYLGHLRLQVPVLHLQAPFLPQSRGQGGVLGVQQGLQVFEPLQGPPQLRLLLGVPAETWSLFVSGTGSGFKQT